MSINQPTIIRLIKKSKFVSANDLRLAQVTASHLGCSITDVLSGRGLLTEENLGKILSQFYKVKYVDLRKARISQKIFILIPEELASERKVIAFGKKGNQIFLALEDPKDLELIELVKKIIGNGVRLVVNVATSGAIKDALKLYQKGKFQSNEFSGQKKITEGSAITILERILEEAVKEEASDIHIEPWPTQALIRFRIDGVLQDFISLSSPSHSALIARVKVLSELKLDEHRHPQDGQFSFQTKTGEKISLRVSTLPTVYGEKLVLRILEDSLTKFNLEELGLLPEDQEIAEKILTKTQGMFLVTGPTGSGKTTTLYTILGLLNKPGVNIVTIEDPVENRIRRVNQIQVNPLINLTFASGLRSILRQDPNIIMVGEIRDRETSMIAVNSAMTGHLVLSSVHANNASGVIPRMVDLGVEPFLLASTLNLVVAQRLVRILCPKCKTEIEMSPLITKKLADAHERVSKEIISSLKKNYQAKGCLHCNYTGFRGRTGIFELLQIDDEIRQLIVTKASSRVIWQTARKKSAKTMLEDGLIKVNKGISSVEEVFRVISE